MLTYNQHLSFFYGDKEKMINVLSLQVTKYMIVPNKTLNIIKRIDNYKKLISCAQTDII